MAPAWTTLTIPTADFDVAALHAAIDALRLARGLSWKRVAFEVNRSYERFDPHPISPSTISGLKDKRNGVEGDGVLQMLVWLGRTPESFVPEHPGAEHPDARLPNVPPQRILRFNVPAIHARLDAQRRQRGMTRTQVAAEIGGRHSAETLQRMAHCTRTGFPVVMQLSRWLHCPAASLTRVANF